MTRVPTSDRLCDSVLWACFPIWHSDCATPYGNRRRRCSEGYSLQQVAGSPQTSPLPCSGTGFCTVCGTNLSPLKLLLTPDSKRYIPPHLPPSFTHYSPSEAVTFPQKVKLRGKTFVYPEKVILQTVSQREIYSEATERQAGRS